MGELPILYFLPGIGRFLMGQSQNIVHRGTIQPGVSGRTALYCGQPNIAPFDRCFLLDISSWNGYSKDIGNGTVINIIIRGDTT